MIFEGFIQSVEKNTVTVKLADGGVLPPCGIGTMGAAGWKPKRDDPVLVAQTDTGKFYVLQRIGTIPDRAWHVGDDNGGMSVTEQGLLSHKSGESKTTIDEEGFDGTYKKFELNGLGVVLKYGEASLEIEVTQQPSGKSHKITITDKVLIEGDNIHFGGDSQGGMILGSKWVAMKKEEWEKHKLHIHPTGTGPSGTSTTLEAYAALVEQKAKDCQSEQVKNEK